MSRATLFPHLRCLSNKNGKCKRQKEGEKITLPFERRVKRVKRFSFGQLWTSRRLFFAFPSFHGFPRPGKSLRKHWPRLDRATLQPRLRSLRFLNTTLRAWMISACLSVCTRRCFPERENFLFIDFRLFVFHPLVEKVSDNYKNFKRNEVRD